MDEKVQEWRKSGKYLPKFMRDFHDQKDTFKALHTTVNFDDCDYTKDISWVAGQVYVIDFFLWHMARHGYVLRKASQKLPFDDIYETNHEAMERWRDGATRATGLTPVGEAR
jgi:hypothetical protein